MFNIDMTAVGSWAERNNVVYGSYQELAAHPAVYDMIGRHTEGVKRSLAAEGVRAAAQIRRFLVLHKELDAEHGELTRTLKVRRAFIAERYAPLLTALYDGSQEAAVSTEVTFEDGRKGTISARVRIRDIRPAGGAGAAARENAACGLRPATPWRPAIFCSQWTTCRSPSAACGRCATSRSI